jgi:hypothetical protein
MWAERYNCCDITCRTSLKGTESSQSQLPWGSLPRDELAGEKYYINLFGGKYLVWCYIFVFLYATKEMSPSIIFLWQSEQRRGWKTNYDLGYMVLIPDNWIDMILPLLFHNRCRLTQPHNKAGSFSEVMFEKPILVATRSKAGVCGRWLAGIAVSNSAAGIYVCLLSLLCVLT